MTTGMIDYRHIYRYYLELSITICHTSMARAAKKSGISGVTKEVIGCAMSRLGSGPRGGADTT
jgi:hypothetical protein